MDLKSSRKTVLFHLLFLKAKEAAMAQTGPRRRGLGVPRVGRGGSRCSRPARSGQGRVDACSCAS